MSDMTAKPHPGKEDPSVKAHEDVQKARQEDEKRKHLQVNVDPAKAASQSQAQQSATHEKDTKISASHNEAARTHDAGRAFQKFANTQAAHNPPPSLESQKIANQQDAMKAADLARQRNPNVKA